MRALPNVPTKVEFVAFGGGLDTVTPALLLEPGYVRDAQNYEQATNGGYSTIKGYERFDGRTAPSAATYAVLACSITGVSVGDVLTDDAGTSFGTVLALPTDQAILTKITGHFSTGNVKVSGVTKGTCTGAEVTGGASTALLHAQYTNLAADLYRADIQAVTGSGDVLGVWVYNDSVYAFRNNAGGTAAVMFKATTSGWSAVSLGEEVSFTSANSSVGEGDTLTQGGVTATITRVVVQSGSLASGVNSGRLILSGRAGGNFAAGAATSTGGGTVTLSGAQSAITFAAPSGRFEFVNHNFSGSASSNRMYGCDGKNRAFEFDGTVFVPIATGMTADVPTHITAHKNQLFLSFVGSVQHSAPGNPYLWSAVTGAGEIALGDTVTGFMPQPGGAQEAALAIFTRNNTSILYGSGPLNWQLNAANQEAGAIAYTIQRMGPTVVMDDRGISSMQTTQAYGNFASATLSQRVQTWLTERRGLVAASCIARDKNQYRLFFSDGSALYCTFYNGEVVGMMPQVFPDNVECIVSQELSTGSEVTYFGSDDGVVYQLDKGTSFDGDAIEAYIYLAFNSSKGHRTLKQYRRAAFEVAGEGYGQFNFTYELGYGSTRIEQPGTQTLEVSLSSVFWDSFVWDAFQWDGQTLIPGDVDMTGSGENVSIIVRSESDYYAPIKISGVTLHYAQRRNLR